jgi:hypothetical protein
MRRIGRWTFNAAAAISLALCVATVVLWVSTYHNRKLYRQPSTRVLNGLWSKEVWIESDTGRLSLLCVSSNGQMVEEFFTPKWLERHGFYVRRTNGIYMGGVTLIIFELHLPHWFLLVVFALPLALRLMARKPRGRVGMCQVCGYDLRATPDRCPECGTVSKEAKAL